MPPMQPAHQQPMGLAGRGGAAGGRPSEELLDAPRAFGGAGNNRASNRRTSHQGMDRNQPRGMSTRVGSAPNRADGELEADDYIVAYDFKPSDDTQLFLVAVCWPEGCEENKHRSCRWTPNLLNAVVFFFFDGRVIACALKGIRTEIGNMVTITTVKRRSKSSVSERSLDLARAV